METYCTNNQERDFEQNAFNEMFINENGKSISVILKITFVGLISPTISWNCFIHLWPLMNRIFMHFTID